MVEAILDIFPDSELPFGALVLFAASLIEYVFPPFPGDTLLLLGGVMVVTKGWSALGVLGATTLGALLGAVIDYQAGRWVTQHPNSWLGRQLQRPKAKEKVAAAKARFRQYGAPILAVNRFMPGIRALFFVAAGIAELRLSRVALWGGLSALAWNALVLLAGVLLGGNLARMQTLLERYTLAAWAIIALIATLVLWRWIRQSARARG